jgi:hypothetical protein
VISGSASDTKGQWTETGSSYSFSVSATLTCKGGTLTFTGTFSDSRGASGTTRGSAIGHACAEHEITGKVVVGCTGGPVCSTRIPLANATVHVRGSKTLTATTDGRGDYSVAVPSGAYTLSPGLGGGYSSRPTTRRVVVRSRDVRGVDFTACAAGALASTASTSTAVLKFSSCYNGVTVRWAPGAPTLFVSWRFQPVCVSSGNGAFVDKAVGPMAFFVREPVRVKATASGGLAEVRGKKDGVLILRIEVTNSGKSGTVDVHNASHDVRSQHKNGLTGSGGEETCFPTEETLRSK